MFTARSCHLTKPSQPIEEKQPKGIIFTGGPNSVYGDGAPQIERRIFELGIPVLGLCYGMQLMAHTLGGKVEAADKREFGKTETQFDTSARFSKICQRRALSG